jgi:hypothetical protein
MADDQDLMAALFVSKEGEITTFSEATSEDDWIDRMDGTVAVRFSRLLVPEPIAVGILRLIRERDEAREVTRRVLSVLRPDSPTRQTVEAENPWARP